MKLSEKLNELIVRPNQWKFHDELIEECQELETMTQWQPIEAAPKDGSIIDVYTPQNGRMTDVSWVIPSGNPAYVKQIPCWCFRYWDGWKNKWDKIDDEPTYWMNLPKPPQAD